MQLYTPFILPKTINPNSNPSAEEREVDAKSMTESDKGEISYQWYTYICMHV